MATTLSLRRRIKSAQNISKTTKAMQMIAASRLKRAQNAALSSRPYVNKLVELTKNLAPKKDTAGEEIPHPYMQSLSATGKTLYIIISPDKGLAGSLVTNLVREYFKVRHEDRSLFVTVGKKIEGTVASDKHLVASFPFGNTLPSYDMIFPLINIIDDHFLNHKVDNVKIITTQFNTVFSQTPKISDLLPVKLEDTEQKHVSGDFHLFEPSPIHLLPPLLKRYIEMQLFQHLLESYASEQAARMIAMQNATDNAKDIVNALQLLYNKARQEKITSEILDISSAAVAMEKGE
jgi:F-type H+-transporting ATPase subunit gamma